MAEKVSEHMKREWRTVHDLDAYATAVITVYREVDEVGGESGAEIWRTNHALFEKRALPLIVADWAARTCRQPEEFPYTLDDVVATWTSWSKALIAKKDEILGVMNDGALFS